MKKRGNLIKILLALVMVALVFSLAACGPDEDEVTPPKKEGPTITEQLVTIIGGAQPLLNTLNGVKADGNLAVDAKISVNHKKDSETNKYEIAIAGNLNTKAPEISISYSDIAQEWFRLAYLDKAIYLNEPLTKVNDGNELSTNKTKIDVAALEPTVQNLMTKLMQMLEGIDITFETKAIEELLTSLDLPLDTLLSIKEVVGGNEIVLSPSQGKDILNTLNLVVKKYASILNPILGMLFNIPENGPQGIDYLVSDGFELPEIYVTVLRGANDGINKIELGYRYSTSNTGSLLIDLPVLSNDEKANVTVAKGDYKKNAIQLNLNAALPNKDGGATADLSALINADFSAKDKNIVGAYLKYKNAVAAQGFFNGTAVKFDMSEAFRILGMTATNGQYQATIKQPNKDDVLQSTSIIDIINNWSADLLVEKEPSTPETPEVNDKEGWSILHHIYNLLGGKVEIKEGVPVAITEKAMLAQLDSKIGKYVRFKVNEDSYSKAISNITDIYNAKKATIEGIFDWNKETYSGGVIITGDKEETKDLLDVVNMFVCLYSEEGGKMDITVANVTDFLDYYVAALYYYANPNDTAYRAESDALKQTLLVAENVYQASNKTAADKTALEAAEKAYKDAMETLRAGKADLVIEQITGIKGGLSAIFAGGTYVQISCEKGGGLNGAISILKSKGGEAMAKLGGSIVLIPEANVATEMAKCEFVADVNNIQEINQFRAPVTEEEKLECLIAELWDDGTVKLNSDGTVMYKKDKEGNLVYDNYYENGQKILGELMDIFQTYMAKTTLAA